MGGLPAARGICMKARARGCLARLVRKQAWRKQMAGAFDQSARGREASGWPLWDNVSLDRGPIDAVEIEAILDVQPVLRRSAKVPSQPRGRVRRDAALLVHDQADAVGRHADRLRQAVYADLFILQILKQDSTRVNWRQLLFSGNRRFRHRSVLPHSF